MQKCKITCWLLASLLLSSCGVYQKSVLLKTAEDFSNAEFQAALKTAERNYVLQPFDKITVEVFTNKGERIPDPNGEFFFRMAGDQPIGGVQGIPNQNTNPNANLNAGVVGGASATGVGFSVLRSFMINEDNNAYLPMIGAVALAGLKLYQADSLLSKRYSEFFEDSYVITNVINHRVTILGALGNRVLLLPNENMSLLEVIALAGNLDSRSRNDRIKLVRNVLNKPVMQVIDLSTWEGLKAASLRVEPNDIIYIEPRRGVIRRETLADFTSITGIFTSILGIVTSTINTIVLIDVLRNR
ncbi:MAG: polysaccharide biosynthesis/export family protein [Cytophagales bacterium]|nr:polysaccharide biosynthesis/export family protein [Bernardetiaceae bacterium]MDW8210169.1 polysaccharide biosynthesis/export family protein [Cytophagales bacterium]